MNHPIVRGTSEEIFPVLSTFGGRRWCRPGGGSQQRQEETAMRDIYQASHQPWGGGCPSSAPLPPSWYQRLYTAHKNASRGESLLYPGTRAGLLRQRGEPNPGAKHFGPGPLWWAQRSQSSGPQRWLPADTAVMAIVSADCVFFFPLNGVSSLNLAIVQQRRFYRGCDKLLMLIQTQVSMESIFSTLGDAHPAIIPFNSRRQQGPRL